MNDGGSSTINSLATFVDALTDYISDATPYIWTIGGAAVAIIGGYWGIKLIVKWFRGLAK